MALLFITLQVTLNIRAGVSFIQANIVGVNYISCVECKTLKYTMLSRFKVVFKEGQQELLSALETQNHIENLQDCNVEMR